MNFNLLNMLTKNIRGGESMQTMPINNSAHINNNHQPGEQSGKYSDYPETFFTKQQGLNQNLQPNPIQNYSQPNFSGLNLDLIKNFLPLFINKSESKNNINDLLKNINPQLSGILSVFTKKENSFIKKESQKDENSMIDMNQYIDIT